MTRRGRHRDTWAKGIPSEATVSAKALGVGKGVQIEKPSGPGAQRGGGSGQGPDHSKDGVSFQSQRETIRVF